MKTIAEIKKKLEKMEDLDQIISTMKNISIVNMTHYERRVKSIRQYFETIEKGFQILLHRNPEFLKKIQEQHLSSPSLGAILIGSEKGLCGDFTEKLLRFFEEKRGDENDPMQIIVIGSKLAFHLENYKIKAYEFPTTHLEISNLLRELTIIIQEWINQKKVGRVAFFYNQIFSNLSYQPKEEQVFPLNAQWLQALYEKPWDSRNLPIFMMEEKTLFYELTHEALYISMYRSFIESLASENVGRLVSMQAAERNIEDRLSELKMGYHLRRQTEITEELFDIMAGFEILKNF